jgi:Saxitoxin biosynthesis operon protein SxtJ
MLLLLAAWNYHRGRMTFVYFLGGAGAALLVIGLLLPPLARGFHVFWMRVATTLGWINSRILLGLMFYGVFTPYNFIGRLIRRDPLDRRGAGRASYWVPRPHTRQTKEQFERTF